MTVQGKPVVRGLRCNLITVQSIPKTSPITSPKSHKSIKFELNTHNEIDLSMNLHKRLAFKICKGLNSLPLLHPKQARMYQSMVKFNCPRSYQKTLNIFWWKRILHIGYRCVSSCCEIRWLSLLRAGGAKHPAIYVNDAYLSDNKIWCSPTCKAIEGKAYMVNLD